ncbi:hypothetical protein EYW49_06585 [Siculibacillus lacustris]|uniref:Sulphotransferase Stf0 domain-containing protein n=1 Tax=Siculibacillus lacustris TaxID=1549641 RepID=A0A4Q9VTV7_9HYPH|nr:Stf0 family sulfotransferase [Siculibacillus lacustris]TBW39531.1 hypothetical protein EYW49_06585 [Siculibacillus lacustris]
MGRPNKSIVIACTLRSGSNLLCELLHRLGYADATEFFQESRYYNRLSANRPDLPQPPSILELRSEFEARHAGLDHYGVKWNLAQYELFLETIAGQIEARDFADWLPNAVWIRLSRRHAIDQAVSLVLARKTGIWVYGDLPAIEKAPVYDFDEIWATFVDLAVEEARWNDHLRRIGVVSVPVVYEDLIDDYGGTMRRILAVVDPAAVDRVAPGEALPPGLLNQSIGNPNAAEFIERFAADLAAGRRSDHDVAEILWPLIEQMTSRRDVDLFSRFLGDHAGHHPVIRKLDLRRLAAVEGDVFWDERPHFLDGIAVRLTPGASLRLEATFARLFIEFLGHPWSGTVKIDVDGVTEKLSLYSPSTVTVPWLLTFEDTRARVITLRPLSEASRLSDGYEVWTQRVWISADAE